MSLDTMREFRKQLAKMLDGAYLECDKVMITRAGHIEHFIIKERLNTIKEIAKMSGIHRIERPHCFCGTTLERTATYKYCSNACKQKAYRIRKGQMKK